MPRHKSARTTRLDLKMISAPLGDFRHTMHIGRGGDAFGDTSFLSNHGPSSPNANSEQPAPTEDNNHDALRGLGEDTDTYELRHSDSVSSFDLDLDLGPSILGDVLGVMDGLALGSDWTHGQDAFSPGNGAMDVISQQGGEDWTGMESVSKETGHSHEHLYEVDGIKSRGLRPKVRFSEKQDEIIGRQDAIERLEVNGKEVTSQSRGVHDFMAKKAEVNNQKVDESPSSSSSLSSECDKKDLHHSESDSEDGTNGDQGYTFDEDSDDEIGL